MAVLGRELIEAASSDGASDPWNRVSKLVLQKRSIHDIAVLAQCHHLQRLDLAHNSITSVRALRSCTALRWLNLAHNSLADLDGLQSLAVLNVLNVSHNNLTSIHPLLELPSLNALIVSDNELTTLPSLAQLTRLNTLVVSSNLLSSLGDALSASSSLLKLSFSHNDVASLKGALRGCPALQELRCAHNSIKVLPSDMESLVGLRIVDAGHNRIATWRSVTVVAELPRLRQLNLMGNPLTQQEGYRAKVLELVPRLSVLDGRRVERDHAEMGAAEAKPSKGNSRAKGTAESANDEHAAEAGRKDPESRPRAQTGRKQGARRSAAETEEAVVGGGVEEERGTREDGALSDEAMDAAANGDGPRRKRQRGSERTAAGTRVEGGDVTSVKADQAEMHDVVGHTRSGKHETARVQQKEAGASEGRRQGRRATEGVEGELPREKRRKAERQNSAQQTGVVKVVVHDAGRGGKRKECKKAKATRPVGTPLQRLGQLTDVGLGSGGPSSWG